LCEKLKVLFLTNLFPFLGNTVSGVFITQRLRALKKLDVDFAVYALSAQDDVLMRVLLKMLGIKPVIVPNAPLNVDGVTYNYVTFNRKLFNMIYDEVLKGKKYLKYSEKIVEQIWNENREEKFDLIHAHGMYNFIPSGLVAMKLSEKYGIPFLVTLHGSDINYRMKWRKGLYLNVLENAAKCIFVSNGLLNKAKSYGYSGKNAIVIPNGYDSEIFKPVDKEQIRKELGIYKDGYKYVGYVGNLIYVKRADKLPEIFKYIHREVPNTKFIVVGDGKYRKKLGKMTEGLDVHFTGMLPQTEVAKWMNAMDVMLLPSRNEGFPTVVNEAQGCGTSVVGSSNGGIPEAIGNGGIVVEEGKDFEKRFTRAVVNLLGNPINQDFIIEKAMQYSWENIVKLELDVYQEVLGNKLYP